MRNKERKRPDNEGHSENRKLLFLLWQATVHFQEGKPLYTLVQFFSAGLVFLSWSDSIIANFSDNHFLNQTSIVRSTIICQVRYGNCESSRLKAIHAAARETAFPASFVQVVKDAHKKWDAEFGAQQIEEIRKRIEACRGFSANLGSWCIDMSPTVFVVLKQNEPSAQPLIFWFRRRSLTQRTGRIFVSPEQLATQCFWGEHTLQLSCFTGTKVFHDKRS